MSENVNPKTYAFIDASNLFYGGEKSLGWKIDYSKLLQYLKEKYSVTRALYFGGVELHGLEFDCLAEENVSASAVEKRLADLLEQGKDRLEESEIILLGRHLKRVRFYLKLESFGYELHLKPVKRYEQEDGSVRRKANCDVDMTLSLLLEKENYNRVIVLSGDGDFLPVLKYLKKQEKDVLVLARSERAAKEIRKFTGSRFLDFEYLKYRIKMDEERHKNHAKFN